MTTPAVDDKTTPEDSPSSPSAGPSSTRRPKVTAPTLGVGPIVNPIPSMTPGNGEAGSHDSGPSEAPADPLDDLESSDTRSESDRRRSRPKPLKVGKKSVSEVLRGAAIGTGIFLNRRLSRSEIEAQQGVWLMDEDSAGDIADPIAAIANRRLGAAGVIDPDIGDLISAGLAAVAYLVQNSIQAFLLRRAFRNMPAGFDTESPTPEGDTQ